MVIVVILVAGAAAYVAANSSILTSSFPGVTTSEITSVAATGGVNLLSNGGFETGNLQGWGSLNGLLPTVEQTNTYRSAYDLRFQTPANGQNLVQCTDFSLGCGSINVSTIYQKLVITSASRATNFSIAINPQFQYPAGLQITLAFALPADPDAQNATIYYVFYQSTQQCQAYSKIVLSGNSFHKTFFCLTIPQGQWSLMERSLAQDLASNIISPAYLDGSTLTLSVSFAGGNSTDSAYVGSVFFG